MNNYPVIDNFDPIRYSGTWYEIAKTLFKENERNCENARAEYQWNQSLNRLEIKNICIMNINGTPQEIGYAQGYATPIEEGFKSENNIGLLNIKFDQFKIYGRDFPIDDSGQYQIFTTDYTSIAIVGSINKDEKMVWVLSRTPKIPIGWMSSINKYIKDLGFNLDEVYLDKDVLIY